MNKETKKLISELTEDKDIYINLAEFVEHLVETDEYYDNEPWNLQQILANVNLMIPVRPQEKINRFLTIAYNAIRLSQLDEIYDKKRLLKELGCTEEEYDEIME